MVALGPSLSRSCPAVLYKLGKSSTNATYAHAFVLSFFVTVENKRLVNPTPKRKVARSDDAVSIHGFVHSAAPKTLQKLQHRHQIEKPAVVKFWRALRDFPRQTRTTTLLFPFDAQRSVAAPFQDSVRLGDGTCFYNSASAYKLFRIDLI